MASTFRYFFKTYQNAVLVGAGCAGGAAVLLTCNRVFAGDKLVASAPAGVSEKSFDLHLPATLRKRFYLQMNPSAHSFQQVNILLVGEATSIIAPLLGDSISSTKAVHASFGQRLLSYQHTDEEDATESRVIKRHWKVGDTYILGTSNPDEWSDAQKAEMKIVTRGEVDWGMYPRRSGAFSRGIYTRNKPRFENKPHVAVMLVRNGELTPQQQWLLDRCKQDKVPVSLITYGSPIKDMISTLEAELEKNLTLTFIQDEANRQQSIGYQQGFEKGESLGYTKGLKEGYSARSWFGRKSPKAKSIVALSSPPEYLTCPLSLEIMEDPVSTPSGFTYSRKALEKHLAQHKTDPITHSALSLDQVKPNWNIKKAVEAWQSQQ